MPRVIYTAPWELSIAAFLFRWGFVVWSVLVIHDFWIGTILPEQRLLFILSIFPGAYVLTRALWWRYLRARSLIWRLQAWRARGAAQ